MLVLPGHNTEGERRWLLYCRSYHAWWHDTQTRFVLQYDVSLDTFSVNVNVIACSNACTEYGITFLEEVSLQVTLVKNPFVGYLLFLLDMQLYSHLQNITILLACT